jgi:acetyl-CoA synthetase
MSDSSHTWLPPADAVERSNVGRWMRELHLDSYDELHRFSLAEGDRFLEMAVEKLGIYFRHRFDRIRDLSGGVESPVWFRRARLNIVDSVFRMKQGLPAIISRREGDSGLRVTSAAELDLMSARIANSLASMGFEPGDAIAIVMPMTPECVAIYLGIIRAGMVVVSIADSFAPEEIATRLRIADARAVFASDVIRRGPRTIPLYDRVRASHAPITIVVGKAEIGSDMRQHDVRFEDFVSDELRFENVIGNPSDTINILFSSGTTGMPKAIPWNHTTPIRCALDGYVHQDIQPGDVVAWPTNVGWMMGPWLIFASLINRATIALFEGSPLDREFGSFIADAGVTMLGVVPSLVRTWKTTGCMHGLDWSGIRAFSSTGEASSAEDMRWLMMLAGDKPVIEYCGGTETGGSYVTSTVIQPNRPSQFSAKTIAADFVILDGNAHAAEHGEVFLVPPSLGHSTRLLNANHHDVYFEGCPTAPDGRVLRRHGDELEALPGGYYRALGRADDTMNLGGIKVSAVELERTMNRLEAVIETAAIGVSPPEGGPAILVVFAVVDGGPDAGALQVELQQQIRGELNPLFRIADLVIVDSLPRTASNKVMRRVLRDRYRAEHR